MEKLSNARVETPVSFRRDSIRDRHFLSEGIRREDIAEFSISKLELEKMGKIIEVLEHPNLQELINEGKITLGAIKPRVNESKLKVEDDDEGERILLNMIDPSLKLIFNISLAPTAEDIENFYPDNVKSRLKSLKEDESNVWDSFKAYMLSGPVTYFLLYSEDGNAVDKWREQMGATNPLNARKGTIRGDFAFSIRQNMVHGSSGDTHDEKVDNVTKETIWLRKKIKSVYEELIHVSQNQELAEEFIRDTGIISNTEQIISVIKMSEFIRSGSESYFRYHRIIFQDQDGKIGSRLVAQKAIVSLSGIEDRVRVRIERLKLLREQGIKTPKLYGVKGADIFEEYISGERPVAEAIAIIKSSDSPRDVRINLLSQLVKIARVLDDNGFIPVDPFYDNLIFDGKDFYFVDTGHDLGGPNPLKKNLISFEQLSKQLKNMDLKEFGEDSLMELTKKLYEDIISN